MSTCLACGATVAEGTAFCGSCGKPMSAGPATASAQPVRTTPDAERMRQAAVQAQSAFMSLGAEKITCIVGGAVGAIGALLPFYSIPTDSMLGVATGGSPSLVGQGGIGLLVLALAIILGGAPLLITLSRLVSLIGFGFAAAVLGLLVGDRTVSFMGQSMPIDFGIGYYLAFLGFAILAYAYGRWANKA